VPLPVAGPCDPAGAFAGAPVDGFEEDGLRLAGLRPEGFPSGLPVKGSPRGLEQEPR
jgi:hypothetical protein